MTVAPGGVGKSSLTIVEALALATGRSLLHEAPHQRARTWLWNGEDPKDELQRRFIAAAKHHAVQKEELDGWLFVDSGRDTELVLVTQTKDGVKIAEPVFDAVVEQIRSKAIDVFVVDPFISSHAVLENDNGAIDRVAKTWAKIADLTGCAVHLVHHARKTHGEAISIEDARGAVALISAARVARTLNAMSDKEAIDAGVEKRFRHFKSEDGKANLAPRSERANWHQIVNVPLGNGGFGADGDFVGVVACWKWPDPTADVSVADLIAVQEALGEEEWRENSQARQWVGVPMGEVLGINVSDRPGKARISALLRRWMSDGWFELYTMTDAKGMSRPCIRVGKRAEQMPPTPLHE